MRWAGGSAREPILFTTVLEDYREEALWGGVGSVAAPTTINYCATKAALEAWSHGLRTEVARFGVSVTVYVAPYTDNDQGRRIEWRGVNRLPVAYSAAQLVAAIDRAPRKCGAGPVYAVLLWLARHCPRLMEQLVGGTRVAALHRSKCLVGGCAIAIAKSRPASRGEHPGLALKRATPESTYLAYAECGRREQNANFYKT